MKVARSLQEVIHDPNSVVTVGTFDGVHLAHCEIIRDIVHRANVKKGRGVVMTFDPHPKEVVTSPKGPVRLLSTIDEKVELIGGLGVDLLVVLEFTFAFSRMNPREFYQRYVVEGTGVDEVVVGYDHMFGRDRGAGIEELVRLGQEFDFSVFAVHPFTVGGVTVSSTLIRHALGVGDVTRAAQFLGRPYVFSGTVVRGDDRGKQLGFPTANIAPASMAKVVPAHGVYAVGVRLGSEQLYGMMNIGVRPTVTAKGAETIEVHLFDFNRDIYGEQISVSFLARLRDEKRFGSSQELVEQLGKDMDEARRTIAGSVS